MDACRAYVDLSSVPKFPGFFRLTRGENTFWLSRGSLKMAYSDKERSVTHVFTHDNQMFDVDQTPDEVMALAFSA